MKGGFWDAFDKSVVISGTLAVILVGGCVAMALMGKVVPDFLVGFTGLACGYYFGSGKAHDVARALKGG